MTDFLPLNIFFFFFFMACFCLLLFFHPADAASNGHQVLWVRAGLDAV